MERIDRVKGTLEEVASYRELLNETTAEGEYHKLSVTLADLEDELRELIQAATAADMVEIIRKLEADATLEQSELELIRLWMVSDAEFYVQMETDYRDWLAELHRLVSSMGELRGERLTVETFGKISGAARDALRVIGDISYFKEQEQRVRNFEAAMARLQADDKRTLARMLAQKLRSETA